MQQPLVSVIIPVFNAEKFLEKAVRSVINQTYNNLEIILINDASADSSQNILKQLEEEDNRIIILNNTENSGISKTLNKGIEKSTGVYIARMDADDICVNTRIEKQVIFLEKNKDVAMCSGNYLKIDEQDNVTGKVIYPTDDTTLKAELFFYCPFAHPAVMMRKSALLQTGLYGDYAPAEDYELWLRMAEKFNIANLSEQLIYYRVHNSNASVVQKSKMFEAMSTVLKIHVLKYGFATGYLQYHLKFLEGTWYTKISKEEMSSINNWRKELLSLHNNNKRIKQVFSKYISLAMLSILKSNQNSVFIKLLAAGRLLTINPLITAKHFLR